MNSAFTYTAADLAEAQQWTGFQLHRWGLDAPHVGAWLNEATRRLGAERTGRVVLDYDPAPQLLLFDVWCEKVWVYGMDAVVAPAYEGDG